MSAELHVTRETPYEDTFRAEKVRSQFDIPEQDTLQHDIVLDWTLPEEWSIGLIVGPSGSGKTTLAHEAFPDAEHYDGNEAVTDWPADEAIVDGFPDALDTSELTEALSRVGFSSPPKWLQPYHTLSTGQRFRADMARLLADPSDGLRVIDEFTSTIDRTVAQSVSNAVQRYARDHGQQLALVTCHYDVAEWLSPDWVADLRTEEVVTDTSFRRPPIDLDIEPVHRSAWKIFREHHYLDNSISDASHCYVAYWDGRPVAFVGVLHHPHPHDSTIKRVTRFVTLPPYQGLGIGTAVLNAVCQHYRDQGNRILIITSHPGLMQALNGDEAWRCARGYSRSSKHTGPKQSLSRTGSHRRKTATFEFVHGWEESVK
jgi:ABC-type lipoprotein export system ATPase subunit/GNAT superfamily N-acetyltransferase